MTLFDWVKENVSILDVIGEYARLQRAGTYWKGSCIFHSETDASFTVSPDRQIFYCFGCQAGGDVIAFVAKAESLSQVEALDYIVEKHGLAVPDHLKEARGKKGADASSSKKAAVNACEFFRDWAREQLKVSPQAQEYLRERRVTQAVIERFALGYFPGGAAQVGKLIRAAHSKGVLVQTLCEAGILLQASHSSYHSPFEERILFPISDSVGRVVGFGGRVFHKGDERPKYYNTKESEAFSKRNLLFGLESAKQKMKDLGSVFLVEGYFDAVALAQHGYENVVATLGTACTAEHLKILSRFVSRVYVMYDGDRAGKKAVFRLAELSWEANLDLYVVKLPDGDDPASTLVKGIEITPFIEGAQHIFDFCVEGMSENFSRLTLSQKVEVGERIASMIARVTDKFKRGVLLQQAAQALGLSFDMVCDLADRQKRRINFDQKGVPGETRIGEQRDKLQQQEGEQDKKVQVIEEQIVAGILNDYDGVGLLNLIDDDVVSYFADDVRELIGLLKARNFNATSKDDFEALIQELSEGMREKVIACSLKRDTPPSEAEFKNLLTSFCRQRWRLVMAQLKADIQKARQSSDYEKMKELLRSFSSLRHDMKSKGLV